MKYTRGNLDGDNWGSVQGTREELPCILACCLGTVHSAFGGQHLWVPECDSIICFSHQGMEQLGTGQDPRSQETPENLEKRRCCAAQSCMLWLLCLGYKVWWQQADISLTVFRWMWVSAPWEKYTYPLVHVCGTARHFVCFLPRIWVSIQGCLQAQNPFKTMYSFCSIMRITSSIISF